MKAEISRYNKYIHSLYICTLLPPISPTLTITLVNQLHCAVLVQLLPKFAIVSYNLKCTQAFQFKLGNYQHILQLEGYNNICVSRHILIFFAGVVSTIQDRASSACVGVEHDLWLLLSIHLFSSWGIDPLCTHVHHVGTGQTTRNENTLLDILRTHIFILVGLLYLEKRSKIYEIWGKIHLTLDFRNRA